MSVTSTQCDQIGRNLDILATLGYNLHKQIFKCTSRFITWFVVDILRFQKWFDVDVLGFQIKLWCKYIGFRATFPKNWAKFYSIFWSHCFHPRLVFASIAVAYHSGALTGLNPNGWLPVLLPNIRLGWKWLTLVNTLAYYNTTRIAAVKSFIVEAQGIFFILKLF